MFLGSAQMKVQNFLRERSKQSGDQVALLFETDSLSDEHSSLQTWTFRALDESAVIYGERLTAAGVKPNMTVAILASNRPETVFVLHALFYIGVKVLMINRRLTDKEIDWQLTHAQADFLITDGETELDSVPKVELEKLQVANGESFEVQEQFCLDDVATIMYTSGTTGHPKAVLQTFANHHASAMSSLENLGLDDHDRWLCILPLYHIGGLSILFRSLMSGLSVYLQENFSAQKANEAICVHDVTIASVVANMLQRMIAEKPDYSDAFKGMLLGGGPAPHTLLETCAEQQITVYQTYGMTETCSQFATLAPVDVFSKFGSAGKPMAGCQLRIVNADRNDCAVFEKGEICVKGPIVTTQYLYGEKSEAFDNGWFYTGDIGYIDEDGYLFVIDRRSDLIVSGGENVYPAEIEAILLSHSEVIEAGVVGMADETWGEVPVAFLVTRESDENMASILETYCLEHMAKYKVPKRFYFVSTLPRNATGKLLRRSLKQWLKD